MFIYYNCQPDSMELNLKKNWKFIIPLIIFIGLIIYFNKAKSIEAFTEQQKKDIDNINISYDKMLKNLNDYEEIKKDPEYKEENDFFLQMKLTNDETIPKAKEVAENCLKLINEFLLATLIQLGSKEELGKPDNEIMFYEPLIRVRDRIKLGLEILQERQSGTFTSSNSGSDGNDGGSFSMDF